MNKIIITGSNTSEAVTMACKQLNVTASKIQYKVLHYDKKSSTIEAWVTETKNLQQSKLRLCPDCEKEISRKADVCPHCGCPIEKTIKCPYCDYDTDKTYKQIQELGYSVECANCGKKVEISTPQQELIWARQRAMESKTVSCPYCNSTNVKKITTTSKAINTALFGVFGTKRHKNYYCNNCKSNF